MGKTAKWLATWAMAGMILAGPALAIETAAQSNRAPMLRQNPIGELQILQNRQDRRDFQFQQKLYREQDRQVVPLQQPPRLRVPKMRSDCPIDITGNAAIGGGDCQ